MSKFYSSVKLRHMKDRNGEIPEIFMISGNRSGGKTVDFTSLMIHDYLEDPENGKFIILVRYMKELGSVATGILEAGRSVFYPDYFFREKIMNKGTYSCLYIGENSGEDVDLCGYVIPLNAADAIKKISSNFITAKHMFFDEFQCDNGTYVPNEVEKLMSIHTSVARGGGESVRHCPVYMASNSTSIANPYFVALGLTNKIQSNTKFYRGEGFVYEHSFIENASEAQKQSAFNRAFGASKYLAHASDNSYLNDNNSCIEKTDKSWGEGRYFCSLYDGDKAYAVRYYGQVGLMHIDHNVDRSYPYKYNISINGELNMPLIQGSARIMDMKRIFLEGGMRFQSIICKQMMLSLLT